MAEQGLAHGRALDPAIADVARLVLGRGGIRHGNELAQATAEVLLTGARVRVRAGGAPYGAEHFPAPPDSLRPRDTQPHTAYQPAWTPYETAPMTSAEEERYRLATLGHATVPPRSGPAGHRPTPTAARPGPAERADTGLPGASSAGMPTGLRNPGAGDRLAPPGAGASGHNGGGYRPAPPAAEPAGAGRSAPSGSRHAARPEDSGRRPGSGEAAKGPRHGSHPPLPAVPAVRTFASAAERKKAHDELGEVKPSNSTKLRKKLADLAGTIEKRGQDSSEGRNAWHELKEAVERQEPQHRHWLAKADHPERDGKLLTIMSEQLPAVQFRELAARLMVHADSHTVDGALAREYAINEMSAILGNTRLVLNMLRIGTVVAIFPRNMAIGEYVPKDLAAQPHGRAGAIPGKPFAFLGEDAITRRPTPFDDDPNHQYDRDAVLLHEVSHLVLDSLWTYNNKYYTSIQSAYARKLALGMEAEWINGNHRVGGDAVPNSARTVYEYFAELAANYLSHNEVYDAETGQRTRGEPHWIDVYEAEHVGMLQDLFGVPPKRFTPPFSKVHEAGGPGHFATPEGIEHARQESTRLHDRLARETAVDLISQGRRERAEKLATMPVFPLELDPDGAESAFVEKLMGHVAPYERIRLRADLRDAATAEKVKQADRQRMVDLLSRLPQVNYDSLARADGLARIRLKNTLPPERYTAVKKEIVAARQVILDAHRLIERGYEVDGGKPVTHVAQFARISDPARITQRRDEFLVRLSDDNLSGLLGHADTLSDYFRKYGSDDAYRHLVEFKAVHKVAQEILRQVKARLPVTALRDITRADLTVLRDNKGALITYLRTRGVPESTLRGIEAAL
ncbi:hypothetical protein [Streptomyces sp. NPDC056785]|uniref:hypothetical protein n=1 Tax=Streptomyces sp. NPDC056785 TaxID=3345944 RepID=UPI0036B90724